MSLKIYVLLILGSICFLMGLIFIIRKTKMSSEFASAWIIFAMCIVILSVFPNIAIGAANIVGFISSVNAMFLFIIFILLCLVFYLFVKLSILENRLNNLVQTIAIKEKKENNRTKIRM